MRALTAGELMAPPRRRSQRMHPPLQPPRKCDATASRASSSPTAAWRSASSPCRISSPAWAPRTLRRGRWRTPCLAGSSCARPRPRIAAAARAMTERRSRSLVVLDRTGAPLGGPDRLRPPRALGRRCRRADGRGCHAPAPDDRAGRDASRGCGSHAQARGAPPPRCRRPRRRQRHNARPHLGLGHRPEMAEPDSLWRR